MAITYSDPDVDTDETTTQLAALTPTDNGVIIGNGSAFVVESGATLKTSLGLTIGTDVQAYNANLTSWAGVTRASGFDTFAATPSSANLRSLVTDETGSGALVFADTPTLVTPVLGVASATTLSVGNGNTTNADKYIYINNHDDKGGIILFQANAGSRWAIGNNIANVASGNTLGVYNYSLAAFGLSFAIGTNVATFTQIPTINGANIPSVSSTDTLTNKTLSSPTISGGAITLSTSTGFSGGRVNIASNDTYALATRYNSSGGYTYYGSTNSATPDGQISNNAGSAIVLLKNDRTVQFSAYGAGTLVTDASGNITASSDEALKYVIGDFTRGLADLRAMDGPVSYQWRGEQIELAEATDAVSDTEAKLAEAQASLDAAAIAAEKEDATDEEKQTHDTANKAIMQLTNDLASQTHRAALTPAETTYTGWTAQGVRKGIPEAIKAGPDGMLNFDERPVLAAMYNALLEMAARIEALEAAQ